MEAVRILLKVAPVALRAVVGKEVAGLKGAVVGALVGEMLRETVFDDVADDILPTAEEIIRLVKKCEVGSK